MRRSSCLVAFVLAAAFLGVDARPAAACVCARTTPCEAFSRSPIVFVGEVLSVERVGLDFRMRLQVVRALKGIASATAEVWSDASSCGGQLAVGGRYVIHTSAAGGRMSISACHYVLQVEDGEPDPELPPVPGRVYGRVTRYDGDGLVRYQSSESVPVPSARVVLERRGRRVMATTDRWGRFQFSDIPPGTYRLAVEAEAGLAPWLQGAVILRDRADCENTYIVLRPTGKVSGRVLTADGKPGGGIEIRLVKDDPVAGSSTRADLTSTTDSGGWFVFTGLGPGSYLLSASPPDAAAIGRKPDAPVWFGGSDRASATRIALAPGMHAELDRAVVLPPPPAMRTFTVAVTCRDGSVPPALATRAEGAGGTVYAEFDHSGDRPIRTLKLRRDERYTLLVAVFIPSARAQGGERRETLAPVDLPAGAPGRDIALVAPFENCATAR